MGLRRSQRGPAPRDVRRAPGSEQVLALQIPDDIVDQARADLVLLLQEAGQQDAIEDQIDPAGHAAGHSKDHFESLVTDRRVSGPADAAQAMFDVGEGLLLGQGFQVMGRDHPLHQLLQVTRGHGFPELGLADEEGLNQRRVPGLKVG